MPIEDPTQSIQSLVTAARDQWIKRLIDPSRANPLLFFRDLKVGMLELSLTSRATTELAAGASVNLGDLQASLPDQRPEAIARSLQAVRTKAISNKEEKGVETLQLALGMATWPALDGGKAYCSPVLLLPLSIEARGQGGLDMVLLVRGEPQLNPVLLHVLSQDYALHIDSKALLEKFCSEDEDGRWSVDHKRLFTSLERLVAERIKELRVVPRAIIANFHFARMSMVEDLRRNGERLAASALVAAIAGDVPTRARLGQLDSGGILQLDSRPAGDDYFVLLADSSQQSAIELGEGGQSLVIQGPPGTGKSQTIANLIAQCVARGKRVLFVAEKRAALDAVIKRLSHPDVDLGHLVLDLHGAAVSRKQVMERLKQTLEVVRQARAAERIDAIHGEFESRRRELNEHARRVNNPILPLDLSMVVVAGELLRQPAAASTKLRLTGGAFGKLNPASIRDLRETMRDMQARPTLHLGTDRSAWTQAKLINSAAAARALELARHAALALVPKYRAALQSVASDTRIEPPQSLAGARELAEVITEFNRIDGLLSADIYKSDPAAIARGLAPACRGLVARAWAALFSTPYRAARAKARSLRVDGSKIPGELLRDVQAAGAVLARWRRLAPIAEVPARSGSTETLARVAADIQTVCTELRGMSPSLPSETSSFDELATVLNALASDPNIAFQIPAVREHQARLVDSGFGLMIDEIRDQSLATQYFSHRFEHILLTTAMEVAFAAEPKLAAFRGVSHSQVVARFCELDAERIRMASLRVRRLHAEAAVEAMNHHPAEEQLVKKEASKKARHMPLRKLLEEAPHVLTRLAPCWVASPLSVSQLLAASNDHFDLVVFDEGSQIPPEDAVPALYRARQVIAAGDQHQLPPTQFFATAVDSEDMEDPTDAAIQAQGAIAGFESLLATLESFLPNRMLEWHYRSEDERLIAFSNNEIYKRLVTFPGARSHQAISHVFVPHDPALGNQEESASGEIQRVVQLVMEHARTRPRESLGVITMGIKHANRVLAAVNRAAGEASRTDPWLGTFFDVAREERFFVKNLETVQGDERDSIILSIGYGKDASGNLPLRFGPLLTDSGYRRLNVAVTRARRRMCVVSSFLAHEIDLARSNARGLAMLKAYLDYAQGGGEKFVGTERSDEMPLNAFEADIRAALEAKGLNLRAQYGASRYRIDLVAMHPLRPGQAVLAIECDGAAYHQGATARDRDRLRQQHLERLGWTFHRIWSTDWFREREAEVAAVIESYRRAVARADADLVAETNPTAHAEEARSIAATQPPAEMVTTATRPVRQLPRPQLPRGESIDNFTERQILDLIIWISSDELLRTDEELMRDALDELGFLRLGARIRERLQNAINRWRGRGR